MYSIFTPPHRGIQRRVCTGTDCSADGLPHVFTGLPRGPAPMPYCLGIAVDAGLVLASDARTNAGIDYVTSYSKLHVITPAPDRLFVLLSAGNLAATRMASRRSIAPCTRTCPSAPPPGSAWFRWKPCRVRTSQSARPSRWRFRPGPRLAVRQCRGEFAEAHARAPADPPTEAAAGCGSDDGPTVADRRRSRARDSYRRSSIPPRCR